MSIHAEDIADYIFHRTVTDIKNLVLRNSRNIFVVGRSGSGKTTQCKKLADAFEMKHISTSELIEQEIKVGATRFGTTLCRIAGSKALWLASGRTVKSFTEF